MWQGREHTIILWNDDTGGVMNRQQRGLQGRRADGQPLLQVRGSGNLDSHGDGDGEEEAAVRA